MVLTFKLVCYSRNEKWETQASNSTVSLTNRNLSIKICIKTGSVTELSQCLSLYQIQEAGLILSEDRKMENNGQCRIIWPITVVTWSKAWTVSVRSNTGVVGSNPTQGMDVCVCLFCVCVVLCVGSGLATGWSPVQRVLSTVYRIKKLRKPPRSKGL
jgi:hypothetical protein